MDVDNPLFSSEEIEMLLEALSSGEGRDVSEEELKEFLAWAGHVRLNAMLLDGILEGDFDVFRDDDGQFTPKVPLERRIAEHLEGLE